MDAKSGRECRIYIGIEKYGWDYETGIDFKFFQLVSDAVVKNQC